MHDIIIILLVILLIWFMIPVKSKNQNIMMVPGTEQYKNEPSHIQFTNAEFKFYK